eukprot:13245204-Alexandrium_andersonii.AAC.1
MGPTGGPVGAGPAAAAGDAPVDDDGLMIVDQSGASVSLSGPAARRSHSSAGSRFSAALRSRRG